MLRRFLYLALPDSDNAIATRGHVRILRFIKPDALGLALVGLRKLIRVSVPVIAVKLNDRIKGRHEGINAEFITDYVLSVIRNANGIKHGIASALQVVSFGGLLRGVHLHQLGAAFGVGIAARYRTILNVVSLSTRRRPPEFFTANCTDVERLVTPLPLVGVFLTTKEIRSGINSGMRNIDGLTTKAARYFLSGSALGPFGLSITRKGAVLPSRWHSFCNRLVARDASNSPNFVFTNTRTHVHIVSQLNQYV